MYDKRWLWLLVLCVPGMVLGRSASASHGALEKLPMKLQCLHQSAGQAGVLVVTLPDGQTVYEHNSHALLTPASLAKILTSYVALKRLGPEHRFTTEVWALHPPQNGVVKGGLWIKGSGDPYLVSENARLLARQIWDRGVRIIDGGIWVDNSYFQPPCETICLDEDCSHSYNPLLSAAAFNFNTLELRIAPGPRAGRPVQVELLPPGDYPELTVRATTVKAKGSAVPLRLKSTGINASGRETFLLTGRISARAAERVEIRCNVSDPASFVARSIQAVLEDTGIAVRTSRTGAGSLPNEAIRLLEYSSPPLQEILPGLNRYSNNFMAEMLLRSLGAAVKGAPATASKGLAVVREMLGELGIPDHELQIENGSGLSRSGKVSSHALCRVLLAAYRDDATSREFMASMAAAGEQGTLQHRLQDLQDGVTVRGKTGSLRDVVGFAGYLAGPAGKGYAAVVLLNDVEKPWEAKSALDGFLIELAGSLAKAE